MISGTTFDPKSVYLSVGGLAARWNGGGYGTGGYLGPTTATDVVVPIASSRIFSARDILRISGGLTTIDHYAYSYNLADLVW